DFELGRSDILRPRFPQKIFGRESETATFAGALARAAAGTPTLVLISGREGSGRGELVRSAASGTYLASGGWSAPSDRPLSGIAQALSSLAARLVQLEEDQIARLRKSFAAKLGQVGQAALDVAPALVDVFGPQPPLPDIGLAQGRSRVQYAVRRLATTLG